MKAESSSSQFQQALVEIEKLRKGSFPALTRDVHGLAFLVAAGAEVANKKCEEFIAFRTVLNMYYYLHVSNAINQIVIIPLPYSGNMHTQPFRHS